MTTALGSAAQAARNRVENSVSELKADGAGSAIPQLGQHSTVDVVFRMETSKLQLKFLARTLTVNPFPGHVIVGCRLVHCKTSGRVIGPHWQFERAGFSRNEVQEVIEELDSRLSMLSGTKGEFEYLNIIKAKGDEYKNQLTRYRKSLEGLKHVVNTNMDTIVIKGEAAAKRPSSKKDKRRAAVMNAFAPGAGTLRFTKPGMIHAVFRIDQIYVGTRDDWSAAFGDLENSVVGEATAARVEHMKVLESTAASSRSSDGAVGSRPAVELNAGGQLEIFAQAPDNTLRAMWQRANGEWSNWHNHGHHITGTPAVTTNEDGRIELFARGPDNALWHMSQKPEGGWTDWQHLGGQLASDPAVELNAGGQLEIFAQAPDNTLRAMWQRANGEWSNWHNHGHHITGTPAVTTNEDGRIELFARGPDNALWHMSQKPEGGWTDWQHLGGQLASDPAVELNAGGQLEIFAQAPDNTLRAMWQRANGEWSNWHNHGHHITGTPAVTTNEDGRIELFARGPDNALWHMSQKPEGGWTDWQHLGGQLASDPAVELNAGGQLEIFAQAPDNTLWHMWQRISGEWKEA